MSKKGFFSAFRDEKKNDEKQEEREEEERVVKFRFNRAASGSIKEHFTVEKRGGKAANGKESRAKVNRTEEKDKTRDTAQGQISGEKSSLARASASARARASPSPQKDSKKRSFFRVFQEESINQREEEDDDDEEEETGRFKFHPSANTEEDLGVERKKSKSSSLVVSPRKKDNVPTRSSPRKSLAKNRKSIVKMMAMSQSYQSYEATEATSSSKPTKSEENKQEKKKKGKKKGKGLTKIDTHFKPISIDDLLKLPETVGDTGLTMDEILDKVDEEIKEQQLKYEKEMKFLDQTLEKQREKTAAMEKRMEANAVLRDRLAEEFTRDKVVKLFEENISYLTDIREGKTPSERHQLFHQNSQSRQSLLYRMITHPFTEDQVDWTYEEFRSRWMKTTRQFHQFNEYMWKVLMPECFIKFYMDIFEFTKEEAEIRIKETPMIDDD